MQRPIVTASGHSRKGGEVWGGLAAMLVALPSAVAYGVAIQAAVNPQEAAAGAVAGVLGAVVLGIVAPLVGGAPGLVSAPCAPAMAMLTAFAVSAGSGGLKDPGRLAALLGMVAVLSAVLQIVFGFIRCGRFIKYIPYPVVSGYMSAVGAIIFFGQLPRFLGLPSKKSLWEALPAGLWQWESLWVGGMTVLGMVGGRKLIRAVPGPIIGLVCGIVAYWIAGLRSPELWQLEGNTHVIGLVKADAGVFWESLQQRWSQMTDLSSADLRALLIPALTLSVLLSIDTLKTCVVLDSLKRSRHNSNRELFGQGTGNLLSALVGGVPGAGTMGATLVNLNSGGRTRQSAVIEGGLTLAVFVGFGRYLAWVPLASLAGILMVVAVRMVDFRTIQLLKQRSTQLDFMVILAVVIVALSTNLIAAAGVGVGLAILLFVREQTRASVIRRKLNGAQVSSKRHRLPEEKERLQRLGQEVTICELQGSLFFGTTDQLFAELEEDLKKSRYLILDLRRVQCVDFTAAHLLQQMEAMLGERQGFVVFSELGNRLPTGQDLGAYFRHLGLVSDWDNVRVFGALDEALEWVEDELLREGSPQAAEEKLALLSFGLFAGLGADAAAGLLECIQERVVPAGQIIFRSGEVGDELFLIRQGVVRIILPSTGTTGYTLATFGRGSFFGDMAFLDRGVRSADAVAATEVHLFSLSGRHFETFVKSHPEMGVRIVTQLARALAERLRYTDAELLALKQA